MDSEARCRPGSERSGYGAGLSSPATARCRTAIRLDSPQHGGPESLAGGLFSAGFGTWLNRPSEYGTHWDGFGYRYGMRLTGVVTSNVMEAGVGALWGEDPRYHRAGAEVPFGRRVGHAVKWTFVAANRDGSVRPAYARFVAISGSNFLSSTWREQSESDVTHSVERIGLGFLGKLAGNSFSEFFPDVKRKFFRRGGNAKDPFLP